MKDEEKKPSPVDIVHMFEQAEAQSANVARYVGGLYKDLIQNGIPGDTACEIVKMVALKLLGVIPQ